MKKWARGLVVCAATAVLSIGAACMAYAAEGEINVNGTGVVQADPDTADISLEISTDGKAAQAAQKENNRITAAVTKAMTDLNVKKDDIVTAYTSVYPTYRYNDETGKRTITGYHAETHLQVKTKDINNTGKYIDAALQAGATGTNGVSVYYDSSVWKVCQMTEDSTLGTVLELATADSADGEDYQAVLLQRGTADSYADFIDASEKDLKQAYGVIKPRKVNLTVDGAEVEAVRCDIQAYYAVLATITYPSGDVVYVSGLTKLASINDIVNLVESVALS